MAKRLAVTDEKFKIASVRLVYSGIINLIDDAMAESKPESAASRVGGSEAFLRAGRPTRRDSGRTKRHTFYSCTHCAIAQAILIKSDFFAGAASMPPSSPKGLIKI